MSETNVGAKNTTKAVAQSKPVATSTSKSGPATVFETDGGAAATTVLAGQYALRRPAGSPGSKILFGVFGAAGGIGKSLTADVIADLYRSAKVRVQTIRLESEVRRGEFGGDGFVALEAFTGAQEKVGGVSALFDDSWELVVRTFGENGVAIIDGGANSHDKFVRLATETGLSQLVLDEGGGIILFVVTTRNADLIR